ncbi:hypothetical protein ACIQU6_01780 [Streptomyces sp. NPDC090442]|uniref:hypothetical protein n=1 Tax=Streptomyces sp. NPDC090442 TaxID=3365962 RepID=UPI0037F36830
MQRARILRLTGLAGTAVLALTVPLAAATAGPADRAQPPAARTAADAPAEPLADLVGALLTSGRTAHCGPELPARHGLTARTCVLTEGGRTWARTSFRNSTGEPPRAALTLLRPDGRNSQADCVVPAGGAPGVCETPGGPTARGTRVSYGAVAEFSDAAGERLRLRSGANWTPGGGSSQR